MFIATVAAILASTTPVAAPTATAPAPAAGPAASTVAANANPRVCVVGMITGSMLRQRTCKTLNDWRAQGFDPLAKR